MKAKARMITEVMARTVTMTRMNAEWVPSIYSPEINRQLCKEKIKGN